MNRTAHILALTGAALQLLFPITLWMSISDLSSAAARVDLNHSGDINRTMSAIGGIQSQMNTAFEPMYWGGGLAIVGLVLFAVAITKYGYRKPWAFWFSCIYGGCLAFMFPTGTPFGLFLLIFALTRRTEFGQPPAVTSHPQLSAE